MRTIMCGIFMFAVSACTYNASAPVSPSYDVYTNYEHKLPGRYALYVNGEDLNGKYKVQGYACSAHNYTQDARNAFRDSVVQTFENLVEHIEVVDEPLNRIDLEGRDLTAQLIVESNSMDVRLIVIPGFWTSDMEADVEISASLRVHGRDGRLLGTTVAADDDMISDAGTGCDGGAEAISLATSGALKKLMGRLGERLANSPRVRDAAENLDMMPVEGVPTS